MFPLFIRPRGCSNGASACVRGLYFEMRSGRVVKECGFIPFVTAVCLIFDPFGCLSRSDHDFGGTFRGTGMAGGGESVVLAGDVIERSAMDDVLSASFGI